MAAAPLALAPVLQGAAKALNQSAIGGSFSGIEVAPGNKTGEIHVDIRAWEILAFIAFYYGYPMAAALAKDLSNYLGGATKWANNPGVIPGTNNWEDTVAGFILGGIPGAILGAGLLNGL
jgi:hypothetical protein